MKPSSPSGPLPLHLLGLLCSFRECDWRQPAGQGNPILDWEVSQWTYPEVCRRQSDALCTSRVQMAFRLWECSLPLRKCPCIWIPLWKTLPINISLSLSPREVSSGLTLDMELDDLLSLVQRGGDLANVGPLVLQSEAG